MQLLHLRNSFIPLITSVHETVSLSSWIIVQLLSMQLFPHPNSSIPLISALVIVWQHRLVPFGSGEFAEEVKLRLLYIFSIIGKSNCIALVIPGNAGLQIWEPVSRFQRHSQRLKSPIHPVKYTTEFVFLWGGHKRLGTWGTLTVIGGLSTDKKQPA